MATESEAWANKNTEKTELTTRTNTKLFKIASRRRRASELLSLQLMSEAGKSYTDAGRYRAVNPSGVSTRGARGSVPRNREIVELTRANPKPSAKALFCVSS